MLRDDRVATMFVDCLCAWHPWRFDQSGHVHGLVWGQIGGLCQIHSVRNIERVRVSCRIRPRNVDLSIHSGQHLGVQDFCWQLHGNIKCADQQLPADLNQLSNHLRNDDPGSAMQ